jgi:DNA-binding CsgD family transcriptional regulator
MIGDKSGVKAHAGSRRPKRTASGQAIRVVGATKARPLAAQVNRGADRMSPLSTHESAVIALASSGLATKEIAALLGISINTVKYHLTNIYRKLGVRSRVDALNAYHRLLQGSPNASVRTILELGTKLAAQIASQFIPQSRAAYFRIEGGMVIPLIEVDSVKAPGAHSFPLAENHHFAEIVSTRRPRIGRVASKPLGPNARVSAAKIGVITGAGVPIVVGEKVHGVLAIGARGSDLPDVVFRRLIDLGQLVEIALANPSFGEVLPRLKR